MTDISVIPDTDFRVLARLAGGRWSSCSGVLTRRTRRLPTDTAASHPRWQFTKPHLTIPDPVRSSVDREGRVSGGRANRVRGDRPVGRRTVLVFECSGPDRGEVRTRDYVIQEHLAFAVDDLM